MSEAIGAANRRFPYIDSHIDRFAEHVSFDGKFIIEIGGDRWLRSSSRFIEARATAVDTINIVEGWPERKILGNGITQRKINANELSLHYEENSVDLAYGIAVLEHISRLWLMIENLEKVLKPGGFAYLHGGPIWTGSRGHHVWTTIGGTDYRFTDDNCPIKPWEHLTNDEDSLSMKLEARGLSTLHAKHISGFVYRSDEQNRYGYSRLCRVFHQSSLELVGQYENAFNTPNSVQMADIRRGAWGDEDRFDVMGITFLLRKPTA
ncbi:MAG: class I SAM-dependent methyltransferase [Notoacmeibacter sp.]|nr:class I SAM-dependent methyltransferase [Notoacmeibacter sp.]